ncbi:STM3941 family protein [Niabella aquatica]
MIIEVPVNKSKALKRFALFVVLLILFTLMAVQPQLFVKGHSYGFIKVAGFIGTFVCIILTAFVAQKVFNKKPGLTIDNEGITDNSLGVMFAKVRWRDVTDITHLQNAGDHYIKITIKDPEKYMEAESHSLKRKMLEMNYNTLRTPVNIAASRLKINFDELFAIVRRELEKHR